MKSVPCPFCGAAHTAGTFVCPTTNRRLQGLLPVGTVIDDKYRIEGIIGVGGMGVVYRAEHFKISRPVALKMLLPEYIVYPDLVARVQREARTAGQIDHPNVVSIVDLGSTTEFGPYIAMELLRGQELATVVERAGGVLDPPEAVQTMREVLAGLEAAHKKGVIHRDLKPENIFLSEDDNGGKRVKVLDFGISKLRDDSELNSLTRTGTVMGTPQFMAPEQAAGARDQDARIDLYAAGAVLYAVLCNGLPYEAENYNLLISEILNRPPVPITRRNPTLDPRLSQIVMKSISKKPDQRYQSAREMADALGEWLEVRTVPYTPTPQLLTHIDEGLHPDDPEYVERGEATQLVPIPYRGDEQPEEIFDTVEAPDTPDDPHQPRSSLNPVVPSTRGAGAPEAPRLRPSSPSVESLLRESPLDAPPLVVEVEPKKPPTESAWERLRTDRPSDDMLAGDEPPRPRSRAWVAALLLVLLAAGAGAALIYVKRPDLVHRLRTLGRPEPLPPPLPPPVTVGGAPPSIARATERVLAVPTWTGDGGADGGTADAAVSPEPAPGRRHHASRGHR